MLFILTMDKLTLIEYNNATCKDLDLNCTNYASSCNTATIRSTCPKTCKICTGNLIYV